MKKAILFVKEKASPDMAAEAAKIRLGGYRVVIANGSVKEGFKDTCDKVFMEKDFEHISLWCRRSFIDYEVLDKEEDAVEDDKDKEEKQVARRGRKPKAESEEEK